MTTMTTIIMTEDGQISIRESNDSLHLRWTEKYFIYLMVILAAGKACPNLARIKNVVTSFTAFKAVYIQCDDERIYKQSF